ncbi:hypothetical protein LPJ78_005349 [Coemansia sp. RSA 989]|nr:hypothetical protein BX667DRAFT_507197 [Coemansia mojavensis]KAJ1738927.1 hypothetical protein LPJ68_005129 [Coemansia sp. RSA 1086]KAJ1750191.1 hypothetical protein LPJ79_003092 [Coemansia sp. RSA 1821]KAJ1861411.1 hypothetical protein LPJ78_005349 [Coemansia sp. RSA 989]KAJ1869408.1 hypothetical protein LPJ55_005378 [Coemansia sp. RSA 990]KAJ2649857.1 hypothetical protein IWW40_002868 [Coemansia sp. RSA 1250]KAJ2672615.1 hypothetical protein IWW42_002769 [Coemansia sp. RSA 1085]
MAAREIHVVVVGGSWAGVTAVQELMSLSQVTYPRLMVTLIEQRTHYFHKTGMIRGLVDKRYAEQMFIPYNRLFNNGGYKSANHRFVCARLKHVHEHFIEVEGGGRVFYDYLVLATGTEYASLPVTQSSTAEECRMLYNTMREAIEMATNILFVGGGAVGIGLCGEIAEMYPEKSITLAHARDKLLNDDLSTGFANTTENRLRRMGVTLLLNETVVPAAPSVYSSKSSLTSTKAYAHRAIQVRPQELVTKSGRRVLCDLAIWTTGSRPNTDFLKTLRPSSEDAPLVDFETGRICVRPSLQLADNRYPYIFAVGDVNSLPLAEKYATSAVNQAKHAVTGIRALIDECYDFRFKMSPTMAAESALRAHIPPYSAPLKRQQTVVVALGKNQEVSTSLFARFNSWARGTKRGRRYMIDKAQKMLNY